jgi:hypothetical protein
LSSLAPFQIELRTDDPSLSLRELTFAQADEYYALILAADNGVSFFSRENNTHKTTY